MQPAPLTGEEEDDDDDNGSDDEENNDNPPLRQSTLEFLDMKGSSLHTAYMLQ